MVDVVKKLGTVADVERRIIALATLDALLCPDWESRYYSFDARWDPKKKHRMGSMRDGEGDDWFALFLNDGRAAIKGFVHDAKRLPDALDGLPKSFAGDFLKEPAFSMELTTFCAWNDNDGWQRSTKIKPGHIKNDGSDWMLALVVGGARDYAKWAKHYFDEKVDPKIVARFFAHEPLTPALARALKRDADVDEVADDLKQIGYPHAR